MERDNVAGVCVRCKQVCEFDLSIKRIDVVAVLVDFIVPDRCDDVANLESSFHCRRARFHIGNVNAAGFAFSCGELTQLRIARWKK